MEILVNCNIIINIESIDQILGKNQSCEIILTTINKESYKMVFDYVWDFRVAIENAYIDRSSKFCHKEERKSSVLIVENSEYINYFYKQISGTRPIDNVKNYIIFDYVDTVIELLTLKEPLLIKID